MNKDILKEYFVNEVVEALTPHLCPIFPRHRWTGSDRTLNFILLLSHMHNLLQEVGPRWVAKVRGLKLSKSASGARWDELDYAAIFRRAASGQAI